MINKTYLIVVLFLIPLFCNAQNLIVNGDFEQHSGPPMNNDNLYTTIGWDYVNGFPEYYVNGFNNVIQAVPHSGDGVVAIGFWINPVSFDNGVTQIDAIGTKLAEPMIAGKHYVFSFWAKNRWWDEIYCAGLQVYGLEQVPAGIAGFSPYGASLDPEYFPNVQLLFETPRISNSEYYKFFRVCIIPETDIRYLMFKGVAKCNHSSVDDYLYVDDVSLFEEETFSFFGNDTTLCEHETLVLNASFQNATITWNDGYGEPIRTITEAGTYSVFVNAVNPVCPIKDTITVDYNLIPIPDKVLRPDTTICYESTITLDATTPDLFYQWSTGSENSSIEVSEPGTYSVTLSNGTCEKADEVTIDFYNCIDCDFFVPNAFSPNDDGINDVLRAYAQCELLDFNMKIYNRWGAPIFETSDIEEGWDGYWKGRRVSDGVYLYVISFSVAEFGIVKHKFSTGDVAVIR